jgi:kumamolisin
MFFPIALSTSRRRHPVDSILVGEPAPDQIIRITLLLRRRNPVLQLETRDRHLTHAELDARYGADPADLEAVLAFAAAHDFSIVYSSLGARAVTISGPLDEMAAAFGADLRLSRIGDSVVRTRQGCLQLPHSLSHCVVGVFGFDQRATAATCRRVEPRATQPGSFTPKELAAIYKFPTGRCEGQTIALIELDGGFRENDLRTYWKQLGVDRVAVNVVSVDGGKNAPTGDSGGPDSEVVLDIQVAGAVAPGAKIVVYFAPNTDQGFINAINTAIHDSVHKPSILSISWGAAENEWTQQTRDAMNDAFHDAALLGITVCAAAGDNGSSDGEPDGREHVDFPASSPWVLACGGTRLTAAGNSIQSETVWNNGAGAGTGGGVSSCFPRPSYQDQSNVPPPPSGSLHPTGRGVPDVAAVADPATGYAVFVDGNSCVIGGTSAAAPLWAGLIALCNRQLGKNLGWLHPVLYGTVAQSKVLNDIVTGTNGAYDARPGWDCCTGLGTPNGQAFLTLLQSPTGTR